MVVDPGVTALQQQLQTLFPGEDIRVSVNDEALILSGSVSSNAVMLRAGEIADGERRRKLKVINMLQLPGGSESQQVMLQVRFAEVNRRALQELGRQPLRQPRATGPAASTTQQFAAPDFDDDERPTFQRFPQPLLLLEARGHRRRAQGAQAARASSRASPSRT